MTGRLFKAALIGAVIAVVTPAVWVMGWLAERSQWTPEDDE